MDYKSLATMVRSFADRIEVGDETSKYSLIHLSSILEDAFQQATMEEEEIVGKDNE